MVSFWQMNSEVSTITCKWQITIPEGVRRKIVLHVGQRIAWEVNDGKLVGRRVRSVGELAGCFKNSAPARTKSVQSDFGSAADARHERISRQKR